MYDTSLTQPSNFPYPSTRHKIEAKLGTLKLNLSDEKIQMLTDFTKHIPVPHSNSMMGLDDSIDGRLEPVILHVVGLEGDEQ